MKKTLFRMSVCFLAVFSLLMVGTFASQAEAAPKYRWKLAQTWGTGFPIFGDAVIKMADMVKEMSKQVQFIYITHNKIAMEMADQLMGVTMHEPGCSRLVSVDVDEAAALAEA